MNNGGKRCTDSVSQYRSSWKSKVTAFEHEQKLVGVVKFLPKKVVNGNFYPHKIASFLLVESYNWKTQTRAKLLGKS